MTPPTKEERQKQRLCRLLIYVAEFLGAELYDAVHRAAEDQYAREVKLSEVLHSFRVFLCALEEDEMTELTGGDSDMAKEFSAWLKEDSKEVEDMKRHALSRLSPYERFILKI